MQNPFRFKATFSKKFQSLWFGFGLLFILLYTGYHANLTHTNFQSSEKFLIEDNFSLVHPNILLFFSDSKTLFYDKDKTIFRPLFAFGLSLDHQLKNPWVFRFHSGFLFLLCLAILYYFPLQQDASISAPQRDKYRLLTLILLSLLPSTTAVLGNIAHRAEISATVLLMIGFRLLNRNRVWHTLIAISFFICAGLTHEMAWAFLLPLGFYLWRKSFDEVFGLLWCIVFFLSAFWLTPSSSPFAATGFMMSIGLCFILQPLLQKLLHQPKLGKPFGLKKHISLLTSLLFVMLLNLSYRNPTESKSSIQEDYHTGIELITTHQWKAALNHFENLYQIAPYHRPTVLTLLETYHALEYWNNLELLSSKTSEKGHLTEIAFQYQKIAASKKSRIVMLEENFAANPTVQNALSLANENYRRGAYAQSAHFSRWILQYEPNSEEALNQLGQAYLKLGNLHDAKRAFQKANGLADTEQLILAAMR